MPEDTDTVPEQSPTRLHPMTLIQRFVLSLPGFAILLLPFLRSPDTGQLASVIAAIAYGMLTLPIIVLRYQRFRYWITPGELVIQSGVLTRKRRSIPIERIQNVEIEQQLLPRLFGMAKVKVVTAGSMAAEGVLEYVSVAEANRIREALRDNRRSAASDAVPLDAATPCPAGTADGSRIEIAAGDAVRTPLFAMDFRLVLLSGMFRFSLLYIALIFSVFQFWEPNPELLLDWLSGPVFGRWARSLSEFPWLAAGAGIVMAAAIAWFSGIVVNLNKFFNFLLTLEDGKLYRKHGLLTRHDGTLPLKKIQTVIYRSNPLMRKFGWWTLEVQTMGLNVKEQGHQIAVPFAGWRVVREVATKIVPHILPASFEPVSRLTIRRAFIRYTVGSFLPLLALASWWRPILWLSFALPLMLVPAVLRYRNIGFSVGPDWFFVKSGVLRHQIWAIPATRFQVVSTSQSLFQRRLGLKSLHVDTAGASPLSYPVVADLPEPMADHLLETLKDMGSRAMV